MQSFSSLMPNALRYAVAGVAVMPGSATSLAASTASPVSAARPRCASPRCCHSLSANTTSFPSSVLSRALSNTPLPQAPIQSFCPAGGGVRASCGRRRRRQRAAFVNARIKLSEFIPVMSSQPPHEWVGGGGRGGHGSCRRRADTMNMVADLSIDSRTASFNSTDAQKTMNGNQVTITCAMILLAAASPTISGRGARRCFACDYSRICAGM
jgi:hypothetical protein